MHIPPTGTVTFLFTDIEGSTKLWQDQPDAMRSALARHDQLLRQSMDDNGGCVFKTVGDAFCAAFATAPQALAGALAAQIALAAEPWATETPLLVRMALHTGNAEERDGDYFGPPLNRVARLLAAGHGGQVLLSGATQELVRDAYPTGTALRELGEHRLRDLGRSENVFQLLHPNLAPDFPPLRSLDSPDLPNNLPPQVTSFIGRKSETAQVKALLQKSRLVTLAGSGGAGKSRLSLQVAADVLDQYPDGAWLVELAPIADPALVPQAVASVLSLPEEPGTPLRDTLLRALRAKNLLLVLDNCEHLLAACATLASDLLRACPQVHVLASSREALGVAGEQNYRIPSLSLPDPRATQTVEALSQYEAVTLFVARAQTVQPSFTVTDKNAPAVAQVCWRLDGIPLALELAAARVRAMSVEQVMARLDDRFRLLTGGSRTGLPRQQTLRSLIDWSYDLLTEGEKTLLRRLSVFAGGWTLEAAESVCSGDGVEDWEVLDLLTSLVDKSLVVFDEQTPDGTRGTRYRLLETVRQYARDRLLESGASEAVRGKHLDFFVGLAEEAEPQYTGPTQEVWLDRLEAEHDNWCSALDWCAGLDWCQAGGADPRSGLRLAVALSQFWVMRGPGSEGIRRLDDALAGRPPVPASAQAAIWAKGLSALGYLIYHHDNADRARPLLEESLRLFQGLAEPRGIATALGRWGMWRDGFTQARPFLEESLSRFQEIGDEAGIATTLYQLGESSFYQGDMATAQRLTEQSLALHRRRGDTFAIATALGSLATVAWNQENFVAAEAQYEECLALRRRIRSKPGIAFTLMGLANVARVRGEYARALLLLEESVALCREVGSLSHLFWALLGLGNVLCLLGDFARASALYRESLLVQQERGDGHGNVAFVLERMASLATAVDAEGQGGPARATRLLGAAQSLREAVSSPLPLVDHADYYDRLMEDVHAAMGDDAFTESWDVGQAMTLDEAVEYALTQE